jgi:hypothetical protein
MFILPLRIAQEISCGGHMVRYTDLHAREHDRLFHLAQLRGSYESEVKGRRLGG